MLETFLAVASLITLIILVRRANRRVVLPNPVLLQREGEYSALLAPHLNTAQPLIEGFIQIMGTKHDATKNSTTQYFEVRDKHTTAHGHAFYLLAITLRGGMLYFQAISPRDLINGDDDSHLKTAQEASARILSHVPDQGVYHAELDSAIISAATAAAQKLGIGISHLAAHADANIPITA